MRDGFIAAYLEQDPAARPHLKIYDVAAETVAGAYRHASTTVRRSCRAAHQGRRGGGGAVNGGKTPELALNFLGDSVNAGKSFYQFALLPEDEARIVARRLVAEGKLKGVTIIADGELGTGCRRPSRRN